MWSKFPNGDFSFPKPQKFTACAGFNGSGLDAMILAFPGKQARDARIAAAMNVQQITYIAHF